MTKLTKISLSLLFLGIVAIGLVVIRIRYTILHDHTVKSNTNNITTTISTCCEIKQPKFKVGDIVYVLSTERGDCRYDDWRLIYADDSGVYEGYCELTGEIIDVSYSYKDNKMLYYVSDFSGKTPENIMSYTKEGLKEKYVSYTIDRLNGSIQETRNIINKLQSKLK